MGYTYFLYHLMIICVSSAEEFSRKLTSYHNPGCQGDYCSSVKVVYVKAEGPNDTLHHLWDFTHKPSVFLAATSNAAKLNPISWDQFQDESNKVISFSEDPVYTFGIVLNKMWEYNDVNDTGLLDRNNHSDTYVQALDMENFSWTILNCTCVNGTDAAELKVQGSNYSTNGSSAVQGTVTLVLRAFGFRDHSEELPHLLHSPNCTQIELVLDNLKTNSNFTNSRFAVDMLLASNDQANTTASIESRKSLDDENSPGVFTLIDLQTPMASSGKGGYLQWRPVAYVAKKRDISNSTETNIYGISDVSNHSSQLNHTLLYAYYSSSVDNYLVQSTTVSFGLKEDGFYKKTNYTSWTFMMGYGKPPDESFSLLVILVISIGLGLPALLIIISGIFMAVRRISQKKDDLFLNR